MFFIILFGIKQLNKIKNRHFKLFINCQVSWDTLYVNILSSQSLVWESAYTLKRLSAECVKNSCL